MELSRAFLWSSILQFMITVPWTLVFCFVRFVRLYHITTKDEYRSLQNKIGQRCSITDGNKGYGYACGMWYLAYVNEKNEIWLMTTPSCYARLVKKQNDKISIYEDYAWDGGGEYCVKTHHVSTEEDLREIIILDRLGEYANPYVRRRKIRFAVMDPRPKQKEMMEAIDHHYHQRRRTVVFVSGAPNTGKSIIGLFLAAHYKSSYCNSFKPWQPGDELCEVYAEVEPKPETPLVLVLDEVDIALGKIHKGLAPHTNIPISVADKQGWNNFLDQIHWGMYPNMIVLLISNQPYEFIHNLDPSYLRQGRVDLRFSV